MPVRAPPAGARAPPAPLFQDSDQPIDSSAIRFPAATLTGKMMSLKPNFEDRGTFSQSPNIRQTPLQIIHLLGNFMRIWSIYSMYNYLLHTGAPVVLFIFTCLVPTSILFLIMQKPWKGRPFSNAQVVPSIINGGITAWNMFDKMPQRDVVSSNAMISGCVECSEYEEALVLW